MPQKRPIRIEGQVAFVALTKGFTAVIDAADVHLVDAWNWCAMGRGRHVYACRGEAKGGKTKSIAMHRVILGARDGEEVDHIDLDTLNNRRSNLRPASHAENVHNQGVLSTNTSGYRGVFPRDGGRRWSAKIIAHGVIHRLGSFATKEDAAAAYAKASAELHGAFSRPAARAELNIARDKGIAERTAG